MKLLLDTHVFLWFVTNDRRLPSAWLSIIANGSNTVFLSMASLWEIAIKSNLGKLRLDMPFERLLQDHIEANGITILPITSSHLIEFERLPLHHRDPFDRLIVAQSIAEQIAILSVDEAFEQYPIRRVG